MSAYPLHPLFKLRSFREENAKREVFARQEAVARAEQIVQQCRQEAEEYAVWRSEEEEALFERIRGREVSLETVERYKQTLLGLRAKERELEEAVAEAEKQLAEARKAEHEARRAHKRACRETLKITKHRKIWNAEESLRLERLADAELEEFPLRSGATEAEDPDEVDSA